MKLIFLDRDGVINQYPGDADYVKSWSEFSFIPRAKAALKRLAAAGFQIYVISNQAGVSKGVYSQEALDFITANMLKELAVAGVTLSGVRYCTHREEDRCPCRKPKTGLVDKVLSDMDAKDIKGELKESYFIGDTIRDIETGRNSGLKTILVFSGKEKPENKGSWPLQPEYTASDLFEAADIIIQ